MLPRARPQPPFGAGASASTAGQGGLELPSASPASPTRRSGLRRSLRAPRRLTATMASVECRAASPAPTSASRWRPRSRSRSPRRPPAAGSPTLCSVASSRTSGGTLPDQRQQVAEPEHPRLDLDHDALVESSSAPSPRSATRGEVTNVLKLHQRHSVARRQAPRHHLRARLTTLPATACLPRPRQLADPVPSSIVRPCATLDQRRRRAPQAPLRGKIWSRLVDPGCASLRHSRPRRTADRGDDQNE